MDSGDYIGRDSTSLTLLSDCFESIFLFQRLTDGSVESESVVWGWVGHCSFQDLRIILIYDQIISINKLI